MSIPAATLQACVAACYDGVTHMSIHTADPGATGASEVADTRTEMALAWSTDHYENSAEVLTPAITAGATVTHVGCWEGSTWRGSMALAEAVVVAPTQKYRQAAGTFRVWPEDHT